MMKTCLLLLASLCAVSHAKINSRYYRIICQGLNYCCREQSADEDAADKLVWIITKRILPEDKEEKRMLECYLIVVGYLSPAPRPLNWSQVKHNNDLKYRYANLPQAWEKSDKVIRTCYNKVGIRVDSVANKVFKCLYEEADKLDTELLEFSPKVLRRALKWLKAQMAKQLCSDE